MAIVLRDLLRTLTVLALDELEYDAAHRKLGEDRSGFATALPVVVSRVELLLAHERDGVVRAHLSLGRVGAFDLGAGLDDRSGLGRWRQLELAETARGAAGQTEADRADDRQQEADDDSSSGYVVVIVSKSHLLLLWTFLVHVVSVSDLN